MTTIGKLSKYLNLQTLLQLQAAFVTSYAAYYLSPLLATEYITESDVRKVESSTVSKIAGFNSNGLKVFNEATQKLCNFNFADVVTEVKKRADKLAIKHKCGHKLAEK